MKIIYWKYLRTEQQVRILHYVQVNGCGRSAQQFYGQRVAGFRTEQAPAFEDAYTVPVSILRVGSLVQVDNGFCHIDIASALAGCFPVESRQPVGFCAVVGRNLFDGFCYQFARIVSADHYLAQHLRIGRQPYGMQLRVPFYGMQLRVPFFQVDTGIGIA